jgi:hypothetical protein
LEILTQPRFPHSLGHGLPSAITGGKVRYAIGEGTVVGTPGNGELAPEAVIQSSVRNGADPSQLFVPTRSRAAFPHCSCHLTICVFDPENAVEGVLERLTNPIPCN